MYCFSSHIDSSYYLSIFCDINPFWLWQYLFYFKMYVSNTSIKYFFYFQFQLATIFLLLPWFSSYFQCCFCSCFNCFSIFINAIDVCIIFANVSNVTCIFLLVPLQRFFCRLKFRPAYQNLSAQTQKFHLMCQKTHLLHCCSYFHIWQMQLWLQLFLQVFLPVNFRDVYENYFELCQIFLYFFLAHFFFFFDTVFCCLKFTFFRLKKRFTI